MGHAIFQTVEIGGDLVPTLSVHQIANGICESLREIGLSESTINTFFDRVVALSGDIQAHGSGEINELELRKAIMRYEDRAAKGEISMSFIRHLHQVARKMNEYLATGTLGWKLPPHGYRKYPVTPYYQQIIDSYMEKRSKEVRMTITIHSGLTKHCNWLVARGINDFTGVTSEILKEYIADSTMKFAPSTVRTENVYLRHFYEHLAESGVIQNTHRLILASKIHDRRKLKPALSRDEVSAVLNSIDRSTTIGKRNYALLLLSTMTGLRAVDIARLKLSDIDWKRGEIRLVQSKTSKSHTLPLTKNVGEALKDYILDGRPQSESPVVFVRSSAPYIGICPSAIASVYGHCFKEAGLSRVTNDGRSFYALRRSLALGMVVTGIPVTTVAQVLGHSNIATVKQYIALDSNRLKICALDFSGIHPLEGGK